MKRLLLTLIVTICAVMAFHTSAVVYSQIITEKPSKVMLTTKSGICTSPYDVKEYKMIGEVLPSREYVRPYITTEGSVSTCTFVVYNNKYSICRALSSGKYYPASVVKDGNYYKLNWKALTGTTQTLTALYSASVKNVPFTLKYDEDGLGYGTFTYSNVEYEYRYVDDDFYLVKVATDMPGERAYFASSVTGVTTKVKPVLKYGGLIDVSGSTSTETTFKVSKNADISIYLSSYFSYNGKQIDRDISELNITNLEDVKDYVEYDAETGQITVKEMPSNTLALNLSTPIVYSPMDSLVLSSASTTVSIDPSLSESTWNITAKKEFLPDQKTNVFTLDVKELMKYTGEVYMIDESALGQSVYSTNYYIDSKDRAVSFPPYFEYQSSSSSGGTMHWAVNGFKNCFQQGVESLKFGTFDLNLTRLEIYSKTTGKVEIKNYKIEIVPYDLPEVKADTKFMAGKIHSGGEGIALTFDMPELYETINPNWGTWTAKITPAFEKMDQATLEEQYAWAHKNNDFADRWWEDTFDTEKEYVCTFDTEKKQLLIPEFNPSTSGMYHITLHASPMKEGYPYPFPFNDKTWDFDFAYHPDHTGLELATQIPYTDNEWEWTAVTHNGTWYGPSDKIPERKEAWKHLSVKPRGGYVDVWYKDISTGAAKAAPQEAPARAASPADDGYKLMDGNYIDASNMNKIRLMVSKNGAVNPNVTDVNLARLDLEQTGVESIDAAAEGDAEYYHLDGRRATGELTPGLYIRSQGGITSKVVVR